MANRFNQYQKVDYVGLPLDAYQLALGSKEAESMAKLNADASTLNSMRSIEAIANPDVQMKNKILSDLNEQIAGLSDKNLKGADVLLQLGRIVSNPDSISKLASIYGNTQNFRSKQQLDREYMQEHGNDINTLRSTDEWDRYNSQGIEGFKTNVLDGYTPGKYVDVVGEIQGVLEKEKASGWEQDNVTGRWINKNSKEEVTTEELLKDAGMMLNDPKYAKQLGELQYAGLRKYGGAQDPITALKTYNTLHAGALNDQITSISSQLADLRTQQAKAPDKTKPQFDKMIEKGQQALAEMSAQRDMYLQDETGQMYSKDMETVLTRAAAAPFDYMKTKNTLEANPYELASYKSSMAFGNAMAMYRRKRADKKEDEAQAAYDEWQNTPIPTVQSLKIKDANGNDKEVTAVQFDKKGGLSIDMMAETIAGAFTKGDLPSGLNIGSKYGMADVDGKNSIVAKLKSGEFQGWYSPTTKEFIITTPNGTSRAPADLRTQQVMDPVYQLFDPTAPAGVKTVEGVSLDGVNTYKVYAYKETKEKEASHYTPQRTKQGESPAFDFSKVSPEQFKTALGMNFNKDALYDAGKYPYEGVLIIAEYKAPSKMFHNQDGSPVNVGTYMQMTSAMTPTQFEQMRKDGYILDGGKAQYIYKRGTTIQFIDPINTGVAGSTISQNQMRFETRPGGSFRNIRTPDMYKKAKSNTGVEDDSDENNLLNIYNQ